MQFLAEPFDTSYQQDMTTSNTITPSPRIGRGGRGGEGRAMDFDYAVKDHIATITFNRPDVLNALTLDIYAQIRDLLEDLRYDDEVKVLVITGEGRGFCSGGDVHEIIGALLERDMRA